MKQGYNKAAAGQQKIARPPRAGLMKRSVNMTELNSLPDSGFRAALDGLWEHSPWIVAEAAAARPFATRKELAARMWLAVREASEERQIALLCAHPDLAGRLARAGALTAESASEQSTLGLDRLDEAEYGAFTRMNTAYRERFDFPFIICVRDNTKAAIRAAFEARLGNSRGEEIKIALDEVRRIAEYRLKDRMES